MTSSSPKHGPKLIPHGTCLLPTFSQTFSFDFFPFSLQFFSEATRVCFNDLQTLRCSPALQIPAASKAPNIFFRRLFVSPLFDSYCFSRLLAVDQINAVIFLAFTDSKRLESARKKRADIQVVPTPNPALISTLFPAHALAYPGSRVQTTPTPTALKTPNNTLLDRTGSHTSAKRQFWVFSRPPAKRYGVLLTFIWCGCRVFRSFQKSWLGHIVKQQKSDVLEYAGEQRSVCKSFKHTRVDSEKQTVD